MALARQDPDELPWLLTYRHLQNGSLEFLKEHTTVKKYNSTVDFENLLKVVRKLFTVSLPLILIAFIIPNAFTNVTIHTSYCKYIYTPFYSTSKISNIETN